MRKPSATNLDPSGSCPRPLLHALAASMALAVCLLSGSAWGHVAFDGIPSGTTFVAGTVAEVKWVDTVTHDTMAYQLSFIASAGATALLIADVPATQHSYMWQVPAAPCGDCSLYVVQDNGSVDYSATVPIVIVASGAGQGTAGTTSTDPPSTDTHPRATSDGDGGIGCTVSRGRDENAGAGALAVVALAVGLGVRRARSAAGLRTAGRTSRSLPRRS